MKTTLVVLAAGMGSRYGGLKQMDPLGPNGEAILEFSAYDAIRAGFDKIVFIIKKEMEKDFIELIGSKIAEKIEVEYVFQDLHHLPKDYEGPAGRVKPWGTAHALWCWRPLRPSWPPLATQPSMAFWCAKAMHWSVWQR